VRESVQSFDGITAFITGGASGLGYALAKSLLARGANCVLADVEELALEQAVTSLASSNNRVKAVVCDVSKRESFRAAVDDAIATFGDIQFLFNNAGVGGGGPMATAKDEAWDWTIGVNLIGVVTGLQSFAPHMLAHGKPSCIVNTASMAGLLGLPGMGPYCASKFAVVAMTESMAVELKDSNIHVAALCPGFVNTQIGNSHRNRPYKTANTPTTPEYMARAKEIAEAIEAGIDADIVGERIIEAVLADELYIFTHPEFSDAVAERHDRIQAAFVSAKNSTVLKAG
jgi:NAD(P)-dependent dehydrogenase (short-subunit alcohol dehydrogenase family)